MSDEGRTTTMTLDLVHSMTLTTTNCLSLPGWTGRQVHQLILLRQFDGVVAVERNQLCDSGKFLTKHNVRILCIQYSR